MWLLYWNFTESKSFFCFSYVICCWFSHQLFWRKSSSLWELQNIVFSCCKRWRNEYIVRNTHKIVFFVVPIVQSLFDLQAPDQSLHQSSHQHIFLSRTITCLSHEEFLLNYQQPSCLSCIPCSNTWTLFSTLNSDMNVTWKLWLHFTVLVQALEAWCMYCRSGFT